MRNKLVRGVNKIIPATAQYCGKMGDKQDELRPSMNELSKSNNKNLVIAEIGVKRGINAKKMLDMMSIKKLYLVDPYLPYEE